MGFLIKVCCRVFFEFQFYDYFQLFACSQLFYSKEMSFDIFIQLASLRLWGLLVFRLFVFSSYHLSLRLLTVSKMHVVHWSGLGSITWLWRTISQVQGDYLILFAIARSVLPEMAQNYALNATQAKKNRHQKTRLDPSDHTTTESSNKYLITKYFFPWISFDVM